MSTKSNFTILLLKACYLFLTLLICATGAYSQDTLGLYFISGAASHSVPAAIYRLDEQPNELHKIWAQAEKKALYSVDVYTGHRPVIIGEMSWTGWTPDKLLVMPKKNLRSVDTLSFIESFCQELCKLIFQAACLSV